MVHATQVSEQVGAGLWSLRVPIPGNPLGHTLVYVLDSDRGPVLVDTGWHDPATWDALVRGAQEVGFALADVHGVLVTHHHPDHHGLSGRVREVSGAWVAMHAADAEVVRRHRRLLQDRAGDHGVTVHADRTGMPEDDRSALAAEASAFSMAPPAVPDVELADGDVADVPGRLVRAVWTPGHSPGHTCFHLPETSQLLSGDHLLPGITPHVGLHDLDAHADEDPLGDFLGSLDRVATLGVHEVLPAHQHRFVGVAARVAEIREHHAQRLVELEERLTAGGEPTLWDLARAMTWNRGWDELTPMMKRIASAEAAAHVRHLVVGGRADRVPGAEPLRFRAGSPVVRGAR